MKNELQIKPLRQYEVSYRTYSDMDDDLHVDVFTADGFDLFMGKSTFYRTGNIIRVYLTKLEKIIVTPIDEEAL